MTFAILILVAVMCALVALIFVIFKLLKTDDYHDDDIIATYSRNEGMAPSKMVRCGDTFFMVYEDENSDRYGIGMGTQLDDLQLIYSTERGRVLDIIGKDNYVLWTQLDSTGISTRVYYVNTGELETICEKQDASRISGSVGICNYSAYFEEADDDGTKVNIVEYNLETGDENVIETVHVVDGVDKAVQGFKVYHNIMNIIEQDLISEIKLVAVDLNTLVKSDTRIGVTGVSDGKYELTLDRVVDIAPNLHRMTYMIHAIEKGKGVLYEIGDKKIIKCAMVDGREVKGSLGVEFGIVYWIEEVRKGDAVIRELHGYNSKARQHIIKINGVSSYIMDEDDMFYFHEHPETGELALCRRGVAGNIKTLDMESAKAEHKERKRQKKLKGKE